MYAIAISGKAKSGKDTVANALINHHTELRAEKLAFADPIKKIALQMFPNTPTEVLWGPSENRSKIIPGTDITYRQLLLDIGKFGRTYDPDIWINSTLEAAHSWLINSKPSLVVISDVRFKNEYFKLRQKGYYIIRVVRPQNTYAIEQPQHASDISEIDLDDIPESEFDFVINNDSSLEKLLVTVKGLPIL